MSRRTIPEDQKTKHSGLPPAPRIECRQPKGSRALCEPVLLRPEGEPRMNGTDTPTLPQLAAAMESAYRAELTLEAELEAARHRTRRAEDALDLATRARHAAVVAWQNGVEADHQARTAVLQPEAGQ